MEFITLSNGVKMPALGYGTFCLWFVVWGWCVVWF